MSTQNPDSKVAADAIHVDSANSVTGPSSTTISVEVDRAALEGSEHPASPGKAGRAYAVIPGTKDGQAGVTEEELPHTGTHLGTDDRVMDSYSATVRSSKRADDEGISVAVESGGESVWATPLGEKSHSRDANEDLPPVKSK